MLWQIDHVCFIGLFVDSVPDFIRFNHDGVDIVCRWGCEDTIILGFSRWSCWGLKLWAFNQFLVFIMNERKLSILLWPQFLRVQHNFPKRLGFHSRKHKRMTISLGYLPLAAFSFSSAMVISIHIPTHNSIVIWHRISPQFPCFGKLLLPKFI